MPAAAAGFWGAQAASLQRSAACRTTRCPTLPGRNAVGGKAAAKYRLAACAPQNHALRSCLFPPEPTCALLQSKKAPRFPRGASRFRGFTINSELIHLV